MKPRDSKEGVARLVNKIQECDPASESLTIEEAREMVMRTGMIIFLGWDLSSSFL